MNECDYCIHGEMCRWQRDADGQGCAFFDDGNKWISCSTRLPENLEPVNITWVNHNPERYYEEIKDKPYTATGHYCKGKWYWYSSTCQDYLEEYGRCDVDEIDKDIEVIAWLPLPKPYRAESEDKE